MAVTGSIVATSSDVGGGVTEYELDWTSDAAAGTVTEVAVAIKRGEIVKIKFTPDAGGTQPDAAYDATLQDTFVANTLVDYLAGTGANLSQDVSAIVTPLTSTYAFPIFWEGGNLYLTIANAGNSKGGIVKLWVRG